MGLEEQDALLSVEAAEQKRARSWKRLLVLSGWFRAHTEVHTGIFHD